MLFLGGGGSRQSITNCKLTSFFIYQTVINPCTAANPEIYMRGPVKASVDAGPLLNYTGGVMWDAPEYRSNHHNHGVEIVGWGYDKERDKQFWIVRNSWGQYWGELSFFRVEMGKNLLMIESNIAWVTPGTFSTWKCKSGGIDQKCGLMHHEYVDPSTNFQRERERVRRVS